MKKFFLTLTVVLSLCFPLHAEVVDLKGNEYVAIDTTRGTFIIRLHPARAPEHVKAFRKLVWSDFYKDLYFHKVIPGYMALTGDPTLIGRSAPNFTLPLEKSGLSHKRGAVGMWHEPGNPNGANTQLYIMHQDWEFMDADYTVFGEVVRGMHVVDQLKKADKVHKAYIIK